MKMKISPREGSALYRLLADVSSDIILKTDRRGFIVHASPALERLGISLPSMLIGPHVQDLVRPDRALDIGNHHDAAIAGRHDNQWTEFPARTRDRSERWFEIQMRRLIDDRGEVYGALSIMRSIEQRRAYEEQLFAAAMTDPLTQLSNRRAFIMMLGHMVEQKVCGSLALFSLDHLKAINMKFGQAAGDEALVAFADVLRAQLRPQDTISRVGGERLGVLLPHTDADEAEAVCQRVVGELGQQRQVPGAGPVRLTASAGVAGIATSVDDTLKRAEMAVFFAKAAGRNRLEVDGKLPPRWADSMMA